VLLVLATLLPASLWGQCTTLPLELGSEVVGNLTQTGCRAQDALPAAVIAAFADLAPLTTQVYAFEIPNPSAVLTAKVHSTEFPPFLILINEQNQILSVQIGDTTTPAGVMISLLAGKYRIVAGSRSTDSGSFVVQTSTEPRRDCTANVFNLGTSVSGQITSSDCRQLDILTPSTGQRLVDAFRFSLSEAAVVDFRMRGGTFYPMLGLVDVKANRVLVDGSETNYGSLDAQILLSLPAGDYLLLAASNNEAGGAYTLRSSFELARPCYNDAIGLPGSVTALLFAGGCRMLDYIPYLTRTNLIQPFRIEVPRRSMVTIKQKSSAFDSYVQLLRSNNASIAVNDDSEGTRHSRLDILLDPGEYKILAGAFDEAEFGEFELSTSIAEPPACPVTEIAPGDTVNAEITETDCRVREMVVEETSDFRSRRYSVTLSKSGTFVLELAVRGFSGGLVMLNEAGRPVNLGFQRVPTGALRGGAALPAGTYTLYIYSGDNRFGTFTLRTVFQ